MRTLIAPASTRRPNPRSLAVLLALLPACGITNPLGQATTEDATEPGTGAGTTDKTDTSEATTAPTTSVDPTTEDTTGDPQLCGNGMCDPSEDAQSCPGDCEIPANCGDGKVDDGEGCDEGAMNGMYGHCDSTCSAVLTCGDGKKNGDEVCDDGPDNSDDYSETAHCNATCTGDAPNCGDGVCQSDVEGFANCPADCTPVCGNGNKEDKEECDGGDGSPKDSADCNKDCTLVKCGDNYVNNTAGEECEDGNQDNTDACTSACKNAKCGDGFVLKNMEACDDGDNTNDNDCGNDCVLPRKVFASNLGKNGALVGLDGADSQCNTFAMLAGLDNNFQAWLSTADQGPAQRFDTSFTGAYKLVNGTVVASNGWADLVDGTIANPIDRTELGAPAVGIAWTNTLANGNTAAGDDCTGWTKSANVKGSVGDLVATDDTWSNLGGGQFCTSLNHLYCFEDPE